MAGAQDSTATKLKSAGRLIACAQIQAIRLAQANVSVGLPVGAPPEPLNVVLAHSAEGRQSEQNLTILLAFNLVGKKARSHQSSLEISCKFEIVYQLPEGLKAGDEEIQAFADTNGMLNSWPYWREYVQSSVIRMGLPPLTLPLYRVFTQKTITEPVASPDQVKVAPNAGKSKTKKRA